MNREVCLTMAVRVVAALERASVTADAVERGLIYSEALTAARELENEIRDG